MLRENRASTAPATSFQLKLHPIAPVLSPPSSRRCRETTTVSSPIFSSPERQSIAAIRSISTAALPSRPRGSFAGVNATIRTRSLPESIPFDPFSSSESFHLLLQSPEDSRADREDPNAVKTFRCWLSSHFPRVVDSLRALRLLPSQSSTSLEEDSSLRLSPACSNNQCNGLQELMEEEEEEDDDRQDEDEAALNEAWSLLFRHAKVLSALPDEALVAQGTTRAERVYFLLNGPCDLSFQTALGPRSKNLLLRTRLLPATADRSIQLRVLGAGDVFGLDAAVFGFECSLVSVVASGAKRRNALGLREAACTYVFCVPFPIVQQLQMTQLHGEEDRNRLPLSFPYHCDSEAEQFLRNTFLFRAMTEPALRFLAANLRPVVVPRHEYLFTPGQSVSVFLIISGQFILGAPRQETAGKTATAELELELLQTHDAVGLLETCRFESSFAHYCVATSPDGARAYSLPSTALLMVLAQELAASKLVNEWMTHRTSWFELRRATALAQRKKSRAGAADGEQVVRLTLATQRRSRLACSRCGWAGHVSTSTSCVCVEVSEPPAGLSMPPLTGSGSNRATTRRQMLGSRSTRHSTQRALPSKRIPVHLDLRLDSVTLEALPL